MCNIALAQSKDYIVTIKTDVYEVLYNTKFQQPIAVNYTVFCKPDSPKYDRDGIILIMYMIKGTWHRLVLLHVQRNG